MHRVLCLTAVVLGWALAAAAGVGAAEPAEKPKEAAPLKKIRAADCVYVPTPNDVVEKMLDMVKPKKGELLYDLGCGDGRIVVMAARKYGCKAVGFEIVPELVEKGRKTIEKRKLQDLASIEQADIFKLDYGKANVVTLYLLPGMILKLVPQLEKLKPGSRIVAHDYSIGGFKADKTVTMTSKEDGVKHTILLYTLPLKKGTDADTDADE